MSQVDVERKFWDKVSQSDNLRDEWICDATITDELCLQAIKPWLKEGKTLDLGCGIGRLTMGYGIDVSQGMLDQAKPGNEYKLCDGETIPYPDNFFSNVFSLCVFQHMPDENKIKYIDEVYRVLELGGHFRLQFVLSGEFTQFNYPTSMDNVVKWCEKAGFDCVTHSGMIFKEWGWLWGRK